MASDAEHFVNTLKKAMGSVGLEFHPFKVLTIDRSLYSFHVMCDHLISHR